MSFCIYKHRQMHSLFKCRCNLSSLPPALALTHPCPRMCPLSTSVTFASSIALLITAEVFFECSRVSISSCCDTSVQTLSLYILSLSLSSLSISSQFLSFFVLSLSLSLGFVCVCVFLGGASLGTAKTFCRNQRTTVRNFWFVPLK